jgi:hypothetical protein
MRSNLSPDVIEGLVEAQKTLRLLAAQDLPEEQRAQLGLYQRQIEDAVARTSHVPYSLVIDGDGIHTYSQAQESFSGSPGTRLVILPFASFYIDAPPPDK